MAYENETFTALQDRRIVDETVVEMSAYWQSPDHSAWSNTWDQQNVFIDNLFEQYAPETSERNRQMARMVGATGLTYLALRYGPNEHHPRLYGGSYEQDVLATYHHAGHSKGFVENAFQYARKVNQVRPGTYDEAAFTRFPIIGAFHDPIIGNGRGNDERQSALLGSEMPMHLGFLTAPDDPTYEGILATTWDPHHMRQVLNMERPFPEYQIAAEVADLLPLFDRRGPYEGVCVIVENMTKKFHDQVLTRAAHDADFSLVETGVEGCLDFIDTSDTLRASYNALLTNQYNFFRTFTPPDSGLDELFGLRFENAAFMQHLGIAHAAGRLSSRQTLLVAREYMLES